jgi:hypothetical protein
MWIKTLFCIILYILTILEFRNSFRPIRVCPSLHMKLEKFWTYFYETWYWGVLLKSVDIFLFWLQSDMHNRHFTWRSACWIDWVWISRLPWLPWLLWLPCLLWLPTIRTTDQIVGLYIQFQTCFYRHHAARDTLSHIFFSCWHCIGTASRFNS